MAQVHITLALDSTVPFTMNRMQRRLYVAARNYEEGLSHGGDEVKDKKERQGGGESARSKAGSRGREAHGWAEGIGPVRCRQGVGGDG